MNNKSTQSRLGPLADRVYWSLKGGIESGAHPVGARMPTEAELCAEFDASRNTVRKALTRLEAERRLMRKTHGGIYVSPPPPCDSSTVSVMYHGDLETLTAVQNMILERNCVMSLFSQREQGWSPELERKFLEQVLRQRHRALLASCTPLPPRNTGLLGRISEAGVRVIHIEPSDAERLPAQSYIMPDYRQAGRAMITALLISGYPRAAFAAMECESPYYILARSGACETLREQGVSVQDGTETGVLLDIKALSTPARLRRIVDKSGGTLGVACSTIQHAISILDAAEKAGVSVPDALGIVALELTGDEPAISARVARVSFDRMAIFTKAVELACGEAFKETAELSAPSIIKTKTITSR